MTVKHKTNTESTRIFGIRQKTKQKPKPKDFPPHLLETMFDVVVGNSQILFSRHLLTVQSIDLESAEEEKHSVPMV